MVLMIQKIKQILCYQEPRELTLYFNSRCLNYLFWVAIMPVPRRDVVLWNFKTPKIIFGQNGRAPSVGQSGG